MNNIEDTDTQLQDSGDAGKRKIQIKTPQSLIHIQHKISLLQYKLWILMLHELKLQFDANAPADEKGFHYIPMQKVIDHFGYEPKKTDIWNDLLALKNETIAFNLLDKDKQKSKYGAGFISEWIVTSNRIGFKFPSILEDVMRGLDDASTIFQMLNWEIFNHFSGKYEAIIYKLCKDYIGVERTPKMSIPSFREYMGVKEHEYPLFKELNRWTISNPIKNINESPVSDISVDVFFNKNGRKIEELYFIVKPKYQTVLPFVEPESHPAFTIAKISISGTEQQAYLAKFPADQIKASLERANEYGEELEAKGKKVNYGAIYKKAIKENWGQQFLEQKLLDQAKKQVTQQKIIDEKKSEESAHTQKQENIKILEMFSQLSEEQKIQLRDAFIAQESIAFKKLWSESLKNGDAPETNPVFRHSFVTFLKDKKVVS